MRRIHVALWFDSLPFLEESRAKLRGLFLAPTPRGATSGGTGLETNDDDDAGILALSPSTTLSFIASPSVAMARKLLKRKENVGVIYSVDVEETLEEGDDPSRVRQQRQHPPTSLPRHLIWQSNPIHFPHLTRRLGSHSSGHHGTSSRERHHFRTRRDDLVLGLKEVAVAHDPATFAYDEGDAAEIDNTINGNLLENIPHVPRIRRIPSTASSLTVLVANLDRFVQERAIPNRVPFSRLGQFGDDSKGQIQLENLGIDVRVDEDPAMRPFYCESAERIEEDSVRGLNDAEESVDGGGGARNISTSFDKSCKSVSAAEGRSRLVKFLHGGRF